MSSDLAMLKTSKTYIAVKNIKLGVFTLFVNSVRCHIMHSSKQVTFTLLLKTNKTGCVYVVCCCFSA